MSNSHHSSVTNEHYTPGEVTEAAHVVMQGIDLDPASCELANRTVGATHIFTKETDGFNQDWWGNVWLNPPGGICDNTGRVVITAKKATKTRPARLSCKESGACGLPPGHEHEDVTSTAKAWWFKLAGQWHARHIAQAVFLGFNLELLQTTQKPCFNSARLPSILKFPLCYPDKRIRFYTPNEKGGLEEGTSPTHANVIAYLPKEWSALEQMRFETLFGDFGECVWPNRQVQR